MANLKHQRWKWLLLPSFLLMQLWYTHRLIQQLAPQAIHAHWIIPQGLVLLFSGLFSQPLPPILLTSHGGDLFSLKGTLLGKLKQRIVKRAAAITVVSSAMREEALRLGAKPHNLYVAPMGVDFEHLFTPAYTATRRTNELLFVGRIVEKKGLIHLLNALPAALQQHPTITLTIAGDGPETPTLKLRAKQLGLSGKVNFLGACPQHELPALYRRASLFIAPFIQAENGDREGLGLVMLEAIACNCPIIASSQEAVYEVLDRAQDAGCLVEPGNAEALARKICHTLDNLSDFQKKTIQRRERLINQFDWEKVAYQYVQLIELNIANNHPPIE